MVFSPFLGLTRDPFAMLRQIEREFDRALAPFAVAAGYPQVNIWQGADSIAVTAELPGVEPGDIDISVKDDVLAISGERKLPEDAEKTTWFRRERNYGRFSRVVELPYRVDPDRVEARFRDGLLQIELHRPEEDKPRRIAITAG
ncbi:MAG TPA: Hsp20/alpha crystallin family protein [Paracoccaceae bacterium]|nr:Hsp20/alpha crystallin family protein [Paracoccaceae bacterium]